MSILTENSRSRVGFFIEHRGGTGFSALMDLVGLLASALPALKPFDAHAPIYPVWSGLVLNQHAAFRHFGVFNVEAFVVGADSDEKTDAMAEAIRARPPRGLVGISREHELQRDLVLDNWLLPGAVIRSDAIGRSFDVGASIDVLGFREEGEESLVFESHSLGLGEDEPDWIQAGLLRHLALTANRRFQSVSAAHGHDALVAHAEELLGLGAVSAAGAVAGVAFEQLMIQSITEEHREWADEQAATGRGLNLHQVIEKTTTGSTRARLLTFKKLRNDVAHHLGDGGEAVETARLYDEIRELLDWLGEHDDRSVPVRLAPVGPWPRPSHQDLHAGAIEHAEQAAASVSPLSIRIVSPVGGDDDVLEEGPFGSAIVSIRDLDRGFTRWLIEEGHAEADPIGDCAVLAVPETHLHRSLGWAWGYSEHLAQLGIRAGYQGRLD